VSDAFEIEAGAQLLQLFLEAASSSRFLSELKRYFAPAGTTKEA
jgi:hypothetical protein